MVIGLLQNPHYPLSGQKLMDYFRKFVSRHKFRTNTETEKCCWNKIREALSYDVRIPCSCDRGKLLLFRTIKFVLKLDGVQAVEYKYLPAS